MLVTHKPFSIFKKFGDDEFRGENDRRKNPYGEKFISCLFTFSCVEVNIFFQLRRLLEGQDAMDFRQFDTKIQVEIQIILLLCTLIVGANFAMEGSFKPKSPFSCWQ